MKNKFKKLSRFMWRLNGILLFVVFCLVIITVASYFLKSTINTPTQSIKIVHDKGSKNNPIKYSINSDVILLKDFYIFEVESNVIFDNRYSQVSHGMGDNNENMIVNLIFISSKTGNEKKLFDKSVLILSKVYASFEDNSYKPTVFTKNLYLIVLEDTNKNGQLDQDDNKCLYVSDYNGERLELLKRNIVNFNIVKENTLLMTTLHEGKKEFDIYDATTGITKRIFNETDLKSE